MRTFYRTLRIFSAITLFFFCWTFMPLWQVAAYAAEKQGQKSGVSRQGSGGAQETPPRPVTSGERFEKALEGIREHINKAEDKEPIGYAEVPSYDYQVLFLELGDRNA